MEKGKLDLRLRLIQQAPMKGKVVLLRVDHNVLKEAGSKTLTESMPPLALFMPLLQEGGNRS